MTNQFILISVFIPTYNPNLYRLKQTLEGLKYQNLSISDWELIIIDNNSSFPFINSLDISWHPNVKIIEERQPGLTYARIKGFQESQAEIIIMVDDDNILDSAYLTNIYKAFKENPKLGAVGGKSIPIFEDKPPIWLNQFYGMLALRDLGEEKIIEKWTGKYPDFAPIGAGMGLRKLALASYIEKIISGQSTVTDRNGTSLSSGGDNDIVLEILKSGWDIAYTPSLSLQHIIPKDRMDPKYLGRLNRDSTKSWIHILENHGINSWQKIPKWTLPLRLVKSFFIYKPWKNETNFIKWKGVCGMYEGQVKIK